MKGFGVSGEEALSLMVKGLTGAKEFTVNLLHACDDAWRGLNLNRARDHWLDWDDYKARCNLVSLDEMPMEER